MIFEYSRHNYLIMDKKNMFADDFLDLESYINEVKSTGCFRVKKVNDVRVMDNNNLEEFLEDLDEMNELEELFELDELDEFNDFLENDEILL